MIRTLERLKDRLAFVLFLLAVAIMLIVYGYLVGTQKLFPYSIVARAQWAFEELWNWAELYSPFRSEEDHPHVILWNGQDPTLPPPASDSDDLTFVSAYRPGSFGFLLVDANGDLRHEWRVPDAVHDRLQQVRWRIPASHHEVLGAHLFANGDVVFNINFQALARIDRCSKLIWYLKENAHHSMFVDADGFIWVPGRHLVTKKQDRLPSVAPPFWDDSIMKVSPDGKVVERISVLQALFDGGYQGLVLQGRSARPTTTSDDPLHLNDVELVSAAFASHHSFAQEGDILVSMRTLDALALIDKDSHRAKFAMAGNMLRQHDPDALANGDFLIFDNRTEVSELNQASFVADGQAFGYSRVVEINPETRDIVWSFEGSKESPFFSSVQGSQEQLDNGDVLVVEPEGGRVFEVDRASKRIVWQFRNKIGKTAKGTLLGRVTGAERYHAGDLSFLDASCD